ncbi:energy transducer TonB [Undibacterium curvum]|uniref:TonB family protein n=1 Tax=Undibacterium curvum TaxID=2762294 RepID=A0ABR7A4S9_9BURK|nr:energy transducer TonB [Undibacterium curvum]MBC3931916.1 TonB family protein [Undibacterium curvum]
MHKYLLLFLLFSSTAFSQEKVSIPTPARSEPIKVPVISLRPTDAPYPKELSSNGVQGTVEVLAIFDADGKPVSASVLQTSRSEKLDLAAIALVKSLTYKPGETKQGTSSTEVLIPIEFLRDSFLSLPQKLCKEFNVDLEYFKSTFPEKKLQEMSVVSLSIGYLVLAGNPSIEKKIALAKSVKEAVPMAISSCSSQPETKFFESFKQAVNELIAKSAH